MIGWKRSSFCESSSCVEVSVGRDTDRIWVRESGSRSVTFSRREWEAFLKGVKAGEFDVETLFADSPPLPVQSH